MDVIAGKILNAINEMVAEMTRFNNQIGPSNPDGDGLNKLYIKYGVDPDPSEAKFNTLDTKSKILYRAEEKVIEDWAISINDLYEKLFDIDTGSGPFSDIDAVKAWITDSKLGDLGARMISNIDVFLALRVELARLISDAEMVNHANAIKAFSDELETQRKAGNIKT
jgi:hypothetical protein